LSFVVAYSGGGWEARWRPLQCFFFFHVKTPVLASSFFFFLFSLSRFSPLYLCASPPFFFLLCFFLLSRFVFSLSFFSSYPPFAALLFCSLFPCIYRQKTWGERSTTPIQSWHRGRVHGAAIMQPP